LVWRASNSISFLTLHLCPNKFLNANSYNAGIEETKYKTRYKNAKYPNQNKNIIPQSSGIVLGRLLFLWGCPQLCKVWKAKHHPQKRHLPRQAGRAQAVWVYGIVLILQANLSDLVNKP
jgi:hypothetical protein